MSIEVTIHGTGPGTLLLVHGSLNDGPAAFQAQLPLAARWKLVVPNRRGYGNSPRSGGVDPDVDARDIAALFDAPLHLVGTSMGGVIAARAAALAPDRVLSLTLIEPPALANAQDIAIVAEAATALERHWVSADKGDIGAFLEGFSRAIRYSAPRAGTRSPAMDKAAQSLMTEKPWLASVPVEALRRQAFPKLLVSGQSTPVFEAICDRLAAEWQGSRRIFPGAGHAVQRIGPPFNELLESFVSGTLPRAAPA
jgi:pimeloyl-ACP methyl ester carboxylesterase